MEYIKTLSSSLSCSPSHLFTHTHTYRSSNGVRGLLENVQCEEVRSPSSCDLGQRKAGMGGFSAICLFEAGAMTAVSRPYLYTEQTQNRRALIQPTRTCVFRTVRKKTGHTYYAARRGDVRLFTMQSKNKLL